MWSREEASTGVLAALNRIIGITVPADKQEGGTYVIPGQGRLADEADVVEYRDMLTIIRDRLRDAAARGQTLEQVKARAAAARLRGTVWRRARPVQRGRVGRGGLPQPARRDAK
jgi:hypothetical protein